MKKITLFLISFLFLFTTIYSQNKSTNTNLKKQLVKGFTTVDKTYDFHVNDYVKNFNGSYFDYETNVIFAETDKAEKFYEAHVNSIDNQNTAWITNLNKFTYEENKKLYAKIRNTEYLIVTLPIKASDLDYNFEKKQFEFDFYGKYPIRIGYNNFPRPLYLVYNGTLNIKVPIEKAKAYSEDINSAVLVLLKSHGWRLLYQHKPESQVIEIEILNTIAINGDSGKPY